MFFFTLKVLLCSDLFLVQFRYEKKNNKKANLYSNIGEATQSKDDRTTKNKLKRHYYKF